VPGDNLTMTDVADTRVRQQIEALYRSDSRRVLATLIRLLGGFDAAEEAMHDAFTAALDSWPNDGVPQNPRAWLISTGRFKAIDAMRRRARFDASQTELADRLAVEATDAGPREAEDIEDEAHNTTRFIVLAKHPAHAKPGGRVMTTFVFRVRNVPAALYKALGGFATNGVNMTKLESYQIGGQFKATQFYADVEGHPEDRSVKLALEELAFFSSKVEILGIYPASGFRERLR